MNLSEKTVLITGSTDGLGKMVATHLAQKGAAVLLHGRDPEKGERTLEEIKRSTGSTKLTYFNADFSSLLQVKKLAEEINTKYFGIDILINNAAVGGGPQGAQQRELSDDGYELRFAINYLATFLLTENLLPLLQRKGTRIIQVSSVGQEAIDFSDVMIERRYSGMRAYRQSKLAMVMYSFDLAERLIDNGVTVNALHPATLMNTKMVIEYFGSALTRVEQGAEALEYLALSSELDNTTGVYFDGKRPSKANPQAHDLKARKQLRALSEELTGKYLIR